AERSLSMCRCGIVRGVGGGSTRIGSRVPCPVGWPSWEVRFGVDGVGPAGEFSEAVLVAHPAGVVGLSGLLAAPAAPPQVVDAVDGDPFGHQDLGDAEPGGPPLVGPVEVGCHGQSPIAGASCRISYHSRRPGYSSRCVSAQSVAWSRVCSSSQARRGWPLAWLYSSTTHSSSFTRSNRNLSNPGGGLQPPRRLRSGR